MATSHDPSIVVVLTNGSRASLEDALDELDFDVGSGVEYSLDKARCFETPCLLRRIDKEDRDGGYLYELMVPLKGNKASIGFWCSLKEGDFRQRGAHFVAISARRMPTRPAAGLQRAVDTKWSGYSDLTYEELDELPTPEEVKDRGDELIGRWGIYLNIQEKAAERREWTTSYGGFKILDGKRNRFRVVVKGLPDEAWESLEHVGISIRPAEDSKRHAWLKPEFIKADRMRDEIRLQFDRVGDLQRVPIKGSMELKDFGTKAEIDRQRGSIERLVAGSAPLECLQEVLFADDSVDAVEEFELDPESMRLDRMLESRINDEQHRAVQLGLQTPDIALIQGPPGTGKTTVIAELCYQLARQGKRVLVAAQTNLAVDNALSKLGEASEVLAVRLTPKVDRLEDEALDFVGDRAVQRWLRGHVAEAGRQLSHLRLRLDMQGAIRVAAGSTGEAWIRRPVENQDLDRLAGIQDAFDSGSSVSHDGIEDGIDERALDSGGGRARDEGLSAFDDDPDVLLVECLGMHGRWRDICRENGFMDDVSPSSMRLRIDQVPDAEELSRVETQLEEAERRLDACLQIDTVQRRQADLDDLLNSRKSKLQRIRSLKSGASQHGFNFIRYCAFVNEIEEPDDLLLDVVDACAIARNRMTQTEQKSMFAARSAAPSGLADHAADTRSILEAINRWKRAGRGFLLGAFMRWRLRRNFEKLAARLGPGSWLTEHTIGQLDIDEVASRFGDFDREREDIPIRLRRLVEASGGCTVSVARGQVTLLRNRRSGILDVDKARSAYAAWMSCVSEHLDMIKARIRIASVAAACREPGSIHSRLFAAGLAPPKDDAERGVLRAKMEVVESWIEACRSNREISVPIRNRFDKQVNVVGATCSHSASRDFRSRFSGFDCVIIDEVSKATPTEMLMPAVIGKRLILVGDHKQLPPVIHGDRTFEEEAEELGYESRELLDGLKACMFKQRFEEFESHEDDRIVMLRDQYRMHPDIMAGVNQFYGGGLRNGLPDLDLLRPHHLERVPLIGRPDSHVIWLDLPSRDPYLVEQVGTSRRNTGQAEVCRDVLESMLRVGGEGLASDIGIIMPYRPQWRVYKNMSGKRRMPDEVRCSSIDRFQGMEREIIILDLVHNHPTMRPSRFLDQHERINVAMSRARSLLVIVGSYDTFVNRYGQDSPYRSFYEVARRTGGLRTLEDLHAAD